MYLSLITPHKENFHWNFAILLMANSLNFNSAYYHIFRESLSDSYNIKNQNSLISNYVNLTNLSKVAKLNFVYIFVL